MASQAIIDIAEICARKGIAHVVVSPGSRSAPLTLSYARHPRLKTWIFPDERSAGYIACGMAVSTDNPVVVTTTSGTAACNLAPAVAEAYYQQIPLIVITADRPPEWIDQHDNQAVRQSSMYGRHVKESYSLPVTYDHPDDVWYGHRIISEAINLSRRAPQGPVHINVPLREPLYPRPGEAFTFSASLKIIDPAPVRPSISDWSDILREWEASPKKLIIAGQNDWSSALISQIQKLTEANIPVVADIISNLHPVNPIAHHDIFLKENQDDPGRLKPDLLITFGKNILSKSLKSYVRKNKAVAHWHLQAGSAAPDTFQSVTRVVDIRPEDFFEELNQSASAAGNSAYGRLWQNLESKARSALTDFMKEAGFGEFKAVYKTLCRLPEKSRLHLANSMPVRYASLIGLTAAQKDIRVLGARGASGIDGCNSSAVGDALVRGGLVVLITGDLAFFYDRNAFWHNYPLHNLRILLLNNHAGGIFRLIDGPGGQPELVDYFETRQNLDAKNTAADFNFDYQKVSNEESFDKALSGFFKTGSKPRLLEVETTSERSKEIFDYFKTITRKIHDT